MWTTMPSE
jgi:hypothetical protein